MGKHVYFDEEAWKKAWFGGSDRRGIRAIARQPDVQAVQAAAHFVGGALLSHEFRLFRNGGLPLLERRRDALVEEIIIEPGPRSLKGLYAPLTVRLHVSHEGLRAIRERYWRVSSRAPIVVASGPLSLLEDPPSYVLWDVAGGGRVLEELAIAVVGQALPWFERFEEPETLHESVLRQEVRMLKPADALEFVLAELGRAEARRFLREIIEFGADVSAAPGPLQRVDETASLRSRLDAVATSFRLR